MVTVEITPEAAEQIEGLPTPIVVRMRNLVVRLRQWPDVSGVKHLKGELAGKHRLRTGDYRLQFRVEQRRKAVRVKRVVKGKTIEEERETVDYRVIVEKAGHRDGFYDE
jgi:mRNA-degrading endonuclease RelE of RelBE toxin-antitoxin system